MANENENPAEYIHIATYLPMRHIWDIPAFMMLVTKIHKQLDAAEGNIAWNAWGGPKQFYTHSIWRNRPSVSAYVRAEPHATAVRRMAVWGSENAAFSEWSDASDATDRDEARRRLETPTFYYRKPVKA